MKVPVMTARFYTLREIDRLRDAARSWYGLGSNLQVTELEERVRTLMIVGTSPDEIETAVATRDRKRRMKR